jgi:hypothetical protein
MSTAGTETSLTNRKVSTSRTLYSKLENNVRDRETLSRAENNVLCRYPNVVVDELGVTFACPIIA